MKTLIAVMTNHKDEYQSKTAAQRATWVKDVKGADVVFFKGRPHPFIFGGLPSDEVWLDVPDDYQHLKMKTASICWWALRHGYDYLWKVDDDVYLRPERLLALKPFDYCGAAADYKRPQCDPLAVYLESVGVLTASPIKACIGWIYGLSVHSMVAMVSQPERASYHPVAEDIWVGQKLLDNGIRPTHLEGRIKKPNIHGVPNGWPNQMPPHPNNEIIAACEYTGPQMVDIHTEFHKGRG
jgi:hypothetical protein